MKNLIKILFVLSFLLPVCVQGQAVTWQKWYSYLHNSITDVIQTFDGGYIMAGSISVPPKVNILLIKLNYLGIVEWDKIIRAIVGVPKSLRSKLQNLKHSLCKLFGHQQ